MNRVRKLATYLLIGSMAFAGERTSAFASQVSADNTNKSVIEESAKNNSLAVTEESVTNDNIVATEESVAGINLSLDEFFDTTDNADEKLTQYLTDEETKDLAFAKVSDYVNIRSKASENSKILGKLYNNSAATVLSKKKGWYKISSGSVNGYIKADFLVTGKKAAKLAETVGSEVATVTTTTLKVRDKASLKSEVLTLIPEGDEFKVVKVSDDWIKLSLGNKKYGYVASEFVKINMEYEEAISMKEELERQAEEDATKAKASTSTGNNRTTSGTSRPKNITTHTSPRTNGNTNANTNTNTNTSNSGLGSRIASYAVQFQGNPYVWGGTSLTKGTDCSGFTQSVFAHFGISIPRTSRTQAAGGSIVSLSNLKVGDLVFYTSGGRINHVALYIGGGRVISASSPSTGIRISSYNYRTPYKAVSYIN